MDNITYEIQSNPLTTQFVCTASEYDKEVCKCKVYTNKAHDVWTISSWFTKPEYCNQGFGKETLKKVLSHIAKTYGIPKEIQYIWNGTNRYVLEWMERHFDAICKCPLAIMKTQSEDDWLSHIYVLNTEKVFRYFEIGCYELCLERN